MSRSPRMALTIHRKIERKTTRALPQGEFQQPANAVLSGIFFGPPGTAPVPAATFVMTDVTTQGNWNQSYGAEGAMINSEMNTGYVPVSVSGHSDAVWANSTSNVRALRKATVSGRIASAFYSWTSLSIDINITDDLSRQVALYCVDWDYGDRSQRIDVLDASSSAVLDTRTISAFSGGQYLVWNLSGHVVIRITRLSGPNAVVSGIFFGGGTVSPGATVSFVGTDALVQGTWKGHYGGNGYAIAGDAVSYPAYTEVSWTGQNSAVWTSSTNDTRALQKAASSDRTAAAWYSWTTLSVDVNITDGQSHPIALYFLDWDNGGRAERVDVVDAVTGTVLDTRTVSGFSGGHYLVWNVAGRVIFRVTLLGGPNAVLSGVFFGPAGAVASSAAFVKTDSVVQGTWKASYGSAGYTLAGDATSYPSYAQVALGGHSSAFWSASTADVRGLQRSATPDRIAATWYCWSSMNVDVNLTDSLTHQVAVYLLDWDNMGRVQKVEVLDSVNGTVLDTRTVSAFSGGQYLVWNLTGHVTIRMTVLGGPNAVFSGLFFH